MEHVTSYSALTTSELASFSLNKVEPTELDLEWGQRAVAMLDYIDDLEADVRRLQAENARLAGAAAMVFNRLVKPLADG